MPISVVLCSRDPRAAALVVRNLRRTALVPQDLQFVVMDNRAPARGICAVYNDAISRCMGDLVVLMHEDAFMMEAGWDAVVRAKFRAEDRLGVLGVAGSSLLLADPPLWSKAGVPWTFGKVTHELDGGREFFLTLLSEDEGDREVAVLDGVWLAVRREVFARCRFDEQSFPGFHFYDVDFCLQAATQGWMLMASTDVRVKHLSAGDFGDVWQSAANSFVSKWKEHLPFSRGETFAAHAPGSLRFRSVDLKGKVPQLTSV